MEPFGVVILIVTFIVVAVVYLVSTESKQPYLGGVSQNITVPPSSDFGSSVPTEEAVEHFIVDPFVKTQFGSKLR